MRNVAVLALALGLAACSSISDSQSRLGQQDKDSCKIEGSSIGHNGLIVNLGSKAVAFTNWVPKQGSPGEYVGFTISVSGAPSVSYVVKAGTSTFSSSAATWLHPDGQSGKGISNVDFCGECEDGSCGGEEECECDENGENCTEPPPPPPGDGPLL